MPSPGADSLTPASSDSLPLSAPVEAWLVEGGDDRIALDPETGLNRYGCGLSPDDSLAGFGSSTASTISPAGLSAAEARRAQLAAFVTPEAAWFDGAAQLKARLARLCGLPTGSEGRIVLAASGTDVCGLAARHARAGSARTLPIILPEPHETGRGVPAALDPDGGPIAVRLREADGRPRPAEAVDAEIEARCAEAIGAAGRALLCVLDVSKTGLVAPSPACAERLKQRFGEALTVLVDACQFRLGRESVAAYLDRGFLVAVTGSKFLGGPAFSGALLLPEGPGPAQAPPVSLPEPPSLGLLLRWEAAASELTAFQALPPPAVARLMDAFAGAVEGALDASPAFERLPAPPLQRFAAHPWDSRPTIFSFLPLSDGRALPAEATQDLYARAGDARLGQPVPVGHRDGAPVSALRLALSCRQVTAAVTSADGERALIEGALAALERTARRIAG